VLPSADALGPAFGGRATPPRAPRPPPTREPGWPRAAQVGGGAFVGGGAAHGGGGGLARDGGSGLRAPRAPYEEEPARAFRPPSSSGLYADGHGDARAGPGWFGGGGGAASNGGGGAGGGSMVQPGLARPARTAALQPALEGPSYDGYNGGYNGHGGGYGGGGEAGGHGFGDVAAGQKRNYSTAMQVRFPLTGAHSNQKRITKKGFIGCGKAMRILHCKQPDGSLHPIPAAAGELHRLWRVQ
jgi:hypothetical protein